MAQRGRPKSVTPTRDKVVPVRFTESEHREVARAAEAERLSLSTFLRVRGVAAAKRSIKRETGSVEE